MRKRSQLKSALFAAGAACERALGQALQSMKTVLARLILPRAGELALLSCDALAAGAAEQKQITATIIIAQILAPGRLPE
jgi:hypothetical protein